MSPIRRVFSVAVLVIATMLLTASCTPAQIQAWFRVHKNQEITLEQASAIDRNLEIWSARNAALARYLNTVAPNQARWERVAACESGGRWNIATGNGYYGGLQFSLGTWRAYGGTGYPHQNSKAQQIRIAERVRTQSGLGHWPRCGSRW